MLNCSSPTFTLEASSSLNQTDTAIHGTEICDGRQTVVSRRRELFLQSRSLRPANAIFQSLLAEQHREVELNKLKQPVRS